MKTVNAWLNWWRSGRTARSFAVEAFRAKYPATAPHCVQAVAEDDKSYVVQILHGSSSHYFASFWAVSKAGFEARELRASDVSHRLFVHSSSSAAE